MKLKQIPEDFIVDEIYDLSSFKEKNENNRIYFYFILKKKNYTQIKAIQTIARIFNISAKFIAFAGTKDRNGITTQIISIYGIKKENFQKNMDFLNENLDDLDLEYVGEFNGRINLGDNLGNKFNITIRDLSKDEIQILDKNFKKVETKDFIFLNYFDEQRFGYANNSHIIGKFILKNEVELAVKEILLSMPKNPKEDHLIFTRLITENWNEIKSQNIEIINKLILDCPMFLRDEKKILEHLLKYKNDFPGAFRKIPKKIRTLYVNAYQSYIFNELIKLPQINSNYKQLELVHSDFDKDSKIGKLISNLLKKDDLDFINFKLKSMPELKLKSVFRDIKNFPKDMIISEPLIDELNENKLKIQIKFSLDPGQYATNIIKQLFKKD